MDIEFHYHVIGLLAARAGFPEDEARIIAYASQHVDDNDVVHEITDGSGAVVYSNYISQTMNIFQRKPKLMRIYPIFHFLPGDPLTPAARRSDGKMHILNTTPDSVLANRLLTEAFASPEELRPYRIGIALHAFADTWAHQNFVGWHDGFNGKLLHPAPNIGHAEAGRHPDWVAHRWTDDRLTAPEIDNNRRFLEAARRIFEALCQACRSDPAGPWPGLERDLAGAFGPTFAGREPLWQGVRLGRYRDLAPWLPDYHSRWWLEEAVEVDTRGLPDTDVPGWTLFRDHCTWRTRQPEHSHWWRFQEAVKAHQGFCMDYLLPVFQQMGVDLHAH